MVEGIFKRAEAYNSAYADLIESLEEYINGVNQYLDGHDIHHDLWDTRLTMVDLASCEMNIVHNDYGVWFDFTYDVPYEDFQDHYSLTILEENYELTHKEIAEDIIKNSRRLYESELKYEIYSLERRLKQLKQIEE